MTRIAFLGTPQAAVPALRALASVHGVHAVFTNPDRPAGRGRMLTAPPVKIAGLELSLPVHQPASWKTDAMKALWASQGIDLAVVVAYGHILPSWMLDSCPLSVWNLHFSLLPRWRGAAPVNHAILAGDEETGVSLMRLEPGLDEGPVLAMSRRPITMQDTSETLLQQLSEDAASLLKEHLPSLLDGTARPEPQDHGSATFASKLAKDMARLDAARPALELHRRIRALQPWPGAELRLDDQLMKVIAVGALKSSGDEPGTLRWDKAGAWLTAGDGQALELTKLQRPGKGVQSALQALQPWGMSGVRHEA
ncbi:MAG: methionyl-tRNA formyltransferase [Acidobacteriota bacterium]|nr:methionyl-tRNA formyltransferase [Acidobacteriota bacterium]